MEEGSGSGIVCPGANAVQVEPGKRRRRAYVVLFGRLFKPAFGCLRIPGDTIALEVQVSQRVLGRGISFSGEFFELQGSGVFVFFYSRAGKLHQGELVDGGFMALCRGLFKPFPGGGHVGWRIPAFREDTQPVLGLGPVLCGDNVLLGDGC